MPAKKGGHHAWDNDEEVVAAVVPMILPDQQRPSFIIYLSVNQYVVDRCTQPNYLGTS